jgi:hypothetical protein
MTPEQRRDNLGRLIYSVRIEHPERGVEEVGRGSVLPDEIAFAKLYHAKNGCKTWVRCLVTGRTLWRAERRERAAGGGAR